MSQFVEQTLQLGPSKEDSSICIENAGLEFSFTLMGVGLALVWLDARDTRAGRVALGLFAGQMVLNVAWTPAFFAAQNLLWGLVVIVALWPAVLATIAAFDRVDRRAAALLVPYLAWVTFAAILNYRFLALN